MYKKKGQTQWINCSHLAVLPAVVILVCSNQGYLCSTQGQKRILFCPDIRLQCNTTMCSNFVSSDKGGMITEILGWLTTKSLMFPSVHVEGSIAYTLFPAQSTFQGGWNNKNFRKTKWQSHRLHVWGTYSLGGNVTYSLSSNTPYLGIIRPIIEAAKVAPHCA